MLQFCRVVIRWLSVREVGIGLAGVAKLVVPETIQRNEEVPWQERRQAEREEHEVDEVVVEIVVPPDQMRPVFETWVQLDAVIDGLHHALKN